MKSRYCAVLISCASVLTANAATIIAELPESANLPQTATMAPQTGNQLLDKVRTRGFGVYAGGNNNSLANWPQNGEGTWINNENVGSIILCGRSGVAGDSFAMVLRGPEQGDLVSSIVFSCDTPASVITSYVMVLAVYDSAGTLVQDLSAMESFTFNSTSRTTTVSLNMADAPLVWGEGYKVVAGVRGGAGPATSPYTLSNIQVAYEIVPEPGSVSLGMLGLGALAVRRYRSR